MTDPTSGPPRRAQRRAPGPAAFLALAVAAAMAGACSNQQDAAAAPATGAPPADAPPADAPPAGAPAAGPNAAGGGRGGRPPLVLAATDVAPVRRGRIEVGIPLSGDLRPIQRVVVRARLEGDLRRVVVRPGDPVRAGQLLAEFDASVQDADQAAAAADVAAARSEVATARWNADQSRELYRAGAIPERDQRLADQALAAARAREAATASRLRAAGRTATDTRVLAPMSGVVESRGVEGTEHVLRGAELFTVVRDDVLELVAAVPERSAAGVRPGQVVRLSVNGQAVDGRVARVSPTVDPTTRAATVYVQLDNADRRFKGNSFATGRAVGRALDGALLVPVAALRQAQEDPAGSAAAGRGEASNTFVYRVRGGTADRAPVSLGVVDERAGTAQVVDGLAEGDQVIVGNVSGIGRGMRVQIIGGERGAGSATTARP